MDKILVLDENGITEYLGNYDYYMAKKKESEEINAVVEEESEKLKLNLKKKNVVNVKNVKDKRKTETK